MRVFVPVEDAPSDASLAMLVPYRCGFVCEHALREFLPAEGCLPAEPALARNEIRPVATG